MLPDASKMKTRLADEVVDDQQIPEPTALSRKTKKQTIKGKEGFLEDAELNDIRNYPLLNGF
jgi:hypothetical protein